MCRLSTILTTLLILITSSVSAAGPFNSSPNDSSSHSAIVKPAKAKSRMTATLGYWNDNFIIDKFLGENVEQGEDDHITASFWLQGGMESGNKWWLLDIYYNILTYKKDSTRTDLLTVRPSISIATDYGKLRFGVGMIASGNFGGEHIQNGYHIFSGNKKVYLPYTEHNEFGLVALLKFQPYFYRNHYFTFNGYAQNGYRSSVGPSNYRLGLELSFTDNFGLKSNSFDVQTQLGYVEYYLVGNYLSPHFDNGVTMGILISWKFHREARFTSWLTNNQYGLKQPHFGISLTLGLNALRLHDLSDVAFP